MTNDETTKKIRREQRTEQLSDPELGKLLIEECATSRVTLFQMPELLEKLAQESSSQEAPERRTQQISDLELGAMLAHVPLAPDSEVEEEPLALSGEQELTVKWAHQEVVNRLNTPETGFEGHEALSAVPSLLEEVGAEARLKTQMMWLKDFHEEGGLAPTPTPPPSPGSPTLDELFDRELEREGLLEELRTVELEEKALKRELEQARRRPSPQTPTALAQEAAPPPVVLDVAPERVVTAPPPPPQPRSSGIPRSTPSVPRVESEKRQRQLQLIGALILLALVLNLLVLLNVLH